MNFLLTQNEKETAAIATTHNGWHFGENYSKNSTME